jgi:hypothetical protein
MEETDPDNPISLVACKLILKSDSAEDRDYARKWLTKRGNQQDVRALGAVVALSDDPNPSPEQTKWLIKRLKEHLESILQHGILATTLEISRMAKDKGSVTAEDITTRWKAFAQGPPLAARVQIGKWLVQNGDIASCAAIISPEEALIQKNAALVYLDVLGSRGQWEEMIQFLKVKDCPLPESMRFLFQARAAKEMGQDSFFDFYWQRAFAAARQEEDSMAYLANYAEIQGWAKEAEEVCRELTRLSDTALIGWMELYNLGLKQKNPQLMQEAMRVLQPRIEEASSRGVSKQATSD